MIFRDAYAVTNPRMRLMPLKLRKFKPTLHRDPTHAPQDGLGGGALWVELQARPIGVVYSMWTYRDGVCWFAETGGERPITEHNSKRPKAYPDASGAINALFEFRGIEGGYEQGPPPGTKPFLRRNP